ncbi:MAG TPA: TonB-dependent receptor plug domain-containing protein [Opitutaceae bacterium]|nr:TonB-dependent receptor plug domain-containing protein [Opitutaceae bacterium]
MPARALLRVTAIALAWGLGGIVYGQNTATPPATTSTTPTAAKDQTVVLPNFEINETAINPYLSKQALSGTRVAMAIQDIPQTVSIVTSDFIKDTMSQRMLDAAKYVTPVVESTLPVGGDRYTIRGFQVSHEFIDGMVISGEDGYSASIAPYNIDRIEVIKGPNAILVPGGAPGGQFNPITKSPFMKDQSTVTFDLAQYLGTAISTDTNRVISQEKGIAVRLVAAIWRADGFFKNSFRNGYEVAPSFSWQLSPTSKLTVKGEFMQNRESQTPNLPLDPSVGSDGYARIATGLPQNWSFGSEQDNRHRRTDRITAELFTTLNDHITSRLQLSADHILRNDQGGTTASIFTPDPTTGALVAFNPTRNPYTGKYEPGVVWTVDNSGPTAVATSTNVPVPNPSTYVYRRINGSDHLYYSEAHLRNDYAGKFENDVVKSTTITGLAANFSKTKWKSFVGQSQGPDVANTNLGAITYTPYVFPEPTPAIGVQNRTAKLEEAQVYVYETASFLQDHLILSAGASRYFGSLTRTDNTGVVAIGDRTLSISSNATSYGAMVRPIKPIGVFFSRNSSGESMPGSLQAGNTSLLPPFKPTNGTQDEYGVKTSLLNDTLTLSASHFNISQTNYAVPNSEYYVLVSQGNQAAANALPTSTYLDVNSKGWELEGSYAWSKNLTLIGNWSNFKYRQPTGVRIRAVPDHIAAFFADYRFTEGALKNFGFNVGVDYHSDEVGESVTALTTSKPLAGVPTVAGVAPGFVAQQASFKVAGRTLTNAGVSYRQKDWTFRIQINNLFDKNYIQAAGSRTAVVPGLPRESRASFTYSF